MLKSVKSKSLPCFGEYQPWFLSHNALTLNPTSIPCRPALPGTCRPGPLADPWLRSCPSCRIERDDRSWRSKSWGPSLCPIPQDMYLKKTFWKNGDKKMVKQKQQINLFFMVDNTYIYNMYLFIYVHSLIYIYMYWTIGIMMGYIMGYVGGCITVCFSWDVHIYIYILQATKPLGGDGRFDSMDL